MTLGNALYSDILGLPAAIERSLHHLLGPGRPSIEAAASAIGGAPRLVVAAIGASHAAAMAFCAALAAQGRPAALEDASELLHYNLGAHPPGTLFVLVSRSGETIEITRLLDLLSERGELVVGVTNVPGSRLGREAGISLFTSSPSDDLIAIKTYGATLLLFDLLAQTVAGRQNAPDRLRDWAGLPEAMEKTLLAMAANEPAWVSEASQDRVHYLLARGASLATAHEGALLFHEMARLNATPATAGHFRHGPWEVVDPRVTTILCAPVDQTWGLNMLMANDLAHMGGHVKLIASRFADGLDPAIERWLVPDMRSDLAPLLEIIPIQCYVYAAAMRQGHVPGQFRASTPITLAESGSLLSR